jgi:hypothetical protein
LQRSIVQNDRKDDLGHRDCFLRCQRDSCAAGFESSCLFRNSVVNRQ